MELAALWITAIFFFFFITYVMTSDLYFQKNGISSVYFLRSELYGASIVVFFMAGILFLLRKFIYPHFFRDYGILLTTLLRSVFLLISFFVVFFVFFQIDSIKCKAINNFFDNQIGNMWILSFAFYCIAVHFFITLFQLSKRRIGTNHYENLLSGKYMVPVVEYRIFMFLGMYSSTISAEESGYSNYSLLLQECFNDLSDLIPKCSAEVYQYLGDEAVLTWRVSEGFDRELCISLYKKFSSRLLEKKELYINKFGLIPKFNASVNEGLVTVAEIGQIKTEIAYHGYGLITACEIRDLCKKNKADFLITNSFYDQLSSTDKKNFIVDGITHVRGRKNPVTVYRAV